MIAAPSVPMERTASEPLAEKNTPSDDAVWPGSSSV